MPDDVTSMQDIIKSQSPTGALPTGSETPTALTAAMETIIDTRLGLPGGTTIAEAAEKIYLSDTTQDKDELKDAVLIYFIRKGLKADSRGHYKYGVTIY